ncbi:hypothetical protein [Streptomyces cacaoi]|uniref:hypothetical protein n=1 Tax=Streptomyces cacaoi TaxID=1898 RepID=UPI0026197DFD|nr:hypothetical protein [Streptomyces cacaoi]
MPSSPTWPPRRGTLSLSSRPPPADRADVPVRTLDAPHGIRPVTEGPGRFQDKDAEAAGHRQARLTALAVPARTALDPVREISR